MIEGESLSSRKIVPKIRMLFNGPVGGVLAVPILRFILSPVIRSREQESWLQLGDLDQFPAGETRLATFRNPVVYASDGETASIPCWVRRIAANRFQVF